MNQAFCVITDQPFPANALVAYQAAANPSDHHLYEVLAGAFYIQGKYSVSWQKLDKAQALVL
jgi:hypothetical protein